MTITCGEKGLSYADALRRVKEKVSLATLGILDKTQMRRTVTGGFIIEIAGKEMGQKVDKLAREIREVLRNEDVRVSCPVHRAELSISSFDDSVTSFEIALELARKSGSDMTEIKMGSVRSMRNGLCSV